MKRVSTTFLKIVLILMALGMLAALLWFPQVEGRNVNHDQFTIYFRDPFLAYIYLGSIPYFIAIVQSFKLLQYIEQNKAFSAVSVRALRNIKYCGLAIVGFIAGAEIYIILVSSKNSDDPAGAIAMGICIAAASFVISVGAAVFQKLLQHAVDLKSENDLAV